MPIWMILRLAPLFAVAVSAVIAALLLARENSSEPPFREMTASAVSAQELEVAADAKVFFGHQSVGMNVLDGVPAVYGDRSLQAPDIVELPSDGAGQQAALRGREGGYLAHAYVGVNGDPDGKIDAFDAMIRGGLGDEVDVAFMKFCYADVISGTDVESVFAHYRDTLAALERDYPRVTFLHVTTPLTTEPGLKWKIKKLLGREAEIGPADNAAREEMNALMRQEYDADRLFDLAALESTDPDGSRLSGSHDGQDYYALVSAYAADPGHLNEGGSEIAAARLLHLVASVALVASVEE